MAGRPGGAALARQRRCGLYLGTVLVRTVRGAVWHVWPDGQPVVRLESGREIDVVAMGHEWADTGAPELSQVYAEVSET